MTTESAIESKRVLLTRPRGENAQLGKLLLACKAVPIELPLIEVEAVDINAGAETQDVLKLLSDNAKRRWLVFSSANAVRYFFEFVRERDVQIKAQIACVGERTAESVIKHGYPVDFVPNVWNARSLFHELPVEPGQTVIYPSPQRVSFDATDLLRSRGVELLQWVLYTTRGVNLTESQKRLVNDSLDAAVFNSASTIDSFFVHFGENRPLLESLCWICLGTSTSARLLQYGFQANVLPEKPQAAAIVAALNEYYAQ